MLNLHKHWDKWVKSLSSESNPYLLPNLTHDEEKSYASSNSCHICTKEIRPESEMYYKVRDHCHITGKYRGAAHYCCNLTYTHSKHKFKIVLNGPTLLHQLITGMDNMELTYKNVTVTDNGMQSITVGTLTFIDSTRFFETKLPDNLVDGYRKLYIEWIEFRAFCLKNYRLDPVHFNTLPSLAWNAAFQDLLDKVIGSNKGETVGKFVYAFVLTIMVYFLIKLLVLPLMEKREQKKKEALLLKKKEQSTSKGK